jgi:hypothetical protein
MIIRSDSGERLRTAVLIPTRGRADYLLKTWKKKMSFLNDSDVFMGIEHREKDWYTEFRISYPNVSYVYYTNTSGSVALAREILRARVVNAGKTQGNQFKTRERPIYDWFVVTDDNAIFTQESLHNLVKTAASWHHYNAVFAGMHNTAAHFDRNLIKHAVKMGGYESYAGVSMMYQVYHRSLYERYSYPMEAFGLDDRHLILWAIKNGGLRRDDFRVAMSAPFTKSRYQEGGQGSIEQRAEKNGRAIARLATDFPTLVGMAGTLRLPWQMIFKAAGDDFEMDRLAGGSMRKEEELFSQPKDMSVKIRRRK